MKLVGEKKKKETLRLSLTPRDIPSHGKHDERSERDENWGDERPTSEE